jgi:Icc protein
MSAIRVIQFTDPHLFGDTAGTLRGINTYESLERTLADASGHIAVADAILVTGDLVQDDAGGYEHFRRIFARYNKPVLCVPGNHDLVPQMRAELSQPPFDLDGPADVGAWRVVLIDSVVANQAGGHVSVEMLTKLDEDLGRARQPFEGLRRGVRLLATPSTCAQFQPRSDQFVIDNQPPAYRLLTLHSNGAIDTGVHMLTAAESAA